GRIESAGSGLPPGRPRCEQRTSEAPRSRSSSIVGSAASLRIASATRPPSRGTLKSTRSSTRSPATGASRTLAFEKLTEPARSEDLGGEVDAAVGVAPLVVVPGDDLDHPAV